MTSKIFLSYLNNFFSLKPTAGQIINTIKYASHFFLDNFHYYVRYDPLSIGVYITYQCNLKCPYCWNPSINTKEFLAENMTIKEFSTILGHPRLQNAFRVSFVGGEPLLHPDLFTFIEICRKKKKLTMFPSNGLLIPKRIDEFKKSCLTSLQISLYDGYIEKQIENARLLKDANPNVELSLARYVTKERESCVFMEEVIGMAESLSIRNICFQNFQPKDVSEAHLSIYDDDKECLKFFSTLKAKYGKRFNIMFPAPLKRDFKKRFCYDLYTVIFVGKSGVIAPCSSIVPPDKKFGTIWDEDFWNNAYFLSHRKNYNEMFPYHPVCEFCYESSMHERSFI